MGGGHSSYSPYLRRVVSDAAPRVARVRGVAVREEGEEEGAWRAQQRAMEGPPLRDGTIDGVFGTALTVQTT